MPAESLPKPKPSKYMQLYNIPWVIKEIHQMYHPILYNNYEK